VSNKPKQSPASLGIRIQPPVLALIHVLLAFALTWLVPLPLVVPPLLQTAGFVIVILGFLLGVGALIAFRRAHSTRHPKDSASPLVTSGVYRLTRNPVYLGFLLMLIGLSLSSGSYWGVFLAPILLILFNRLVIRPEEEYLAAKYGEEFTSYREKVRRWM
jgi:protein-S-isoprenylcysteine O-methyltransferase Ste14